MGAYLDRAREINRQNAIAMARRNALISHTAAAGIAAIGSIGLAFGLSLPMRAPASSYDLVRYVGTESETVESGLSLDDCSNVIPRMRAMGFNVACEAPLSISN